MSLNDNNKLEYDLLSVNAVGDSERKNLDKTKLENVHIAKSPAEVKNLDIGKLMLVKVPHDYYGAMNPLADEYRLVTRVRINGKEVFLYLAMNEYDNI
tara:strand:+ start:9629 stop:9922 length:294 start_codon:yes stop_codon:yes gene_type:complete